MTTTKTRTTRAAKPAAAPSKPTRAKVTPTPKESVGEKEPAKAATKPEAKTLLEALSTGQAVLVKVRANGTKRSLPYLAPKSDVRQTAVTVETRRQAGETIEAIAEDMNISIATVRRYISNLALAHAVEDGTHDKAWTKGTKNVVVHTVQAKA